MLGANASLRLDPISGRTSAPKSTIAPIRITVGLGRSLLNELGIKGISRNSVCRNHRTAF